MNYQIKLQQNKSNTTLGTKIISCGVHLPKKIVTSKEIFESFDSLAKYDIPHDWMNKKMGIIQRRMADESVSPSDLAIQAAEHAISEVNKNYIDAVIFCGIERDQPEPATAHEINKRLGLKARYAFDVANACFGFFDGMRIASSLIQSNAASLVLVTTGEVPTRLTRKVINEANNGLSKAEFTKKLGFLSVGDAGGAVIIGKSPDGGKTGFNSFTCETLSEHNDLCYYDHKPDGSLDAAMHMAKIVAKTYRLQNSMFEKAFQSESWVKPKFLMVHQVGKKSHDEVISLGIVPSDRVIKSYDVLGNITSATFPINYHQLMNHPDLKSGDNVYAAYSGSGIVAGQIAFRC